MNILITIAMVKENDIYIHHLERFIWISGAIIPIRIAKAPLPHFPVPKCLLY